MLVTGSVLLGSVVLARADDTVAVWGVRRALPAGARLADGDVDRRQVRLSGSDLARYLVAGGAAPVGKRLGRAVGAGELLPAAALVTGTPVDGVQVPLTLAVGDLPEAVRAGSVIDAWVVPLEGAQRSVGAVTARRVLREVPVLAVSRRDDPLAPATTRSLVVEVPQATDLAAVLGAFSGARVVLTVAGSR
ncbi:MAG: uncharacterized protein JWQ74_977 [Marmoricola sp.]|nr:uncharacterized protein [Marmoricola sp.]